MEQHLERREAEEASEIRKGMNSAERSRLREIIKHAEKLRGGRKNDPKEGSWLELGQKDVTAHSATMKVKPSRCWMNNVYTVQGYDVDASGQPMTALMVSRHDEKRIKNHWEKLQRIKQELLGVDKLGVELYPDKSREIKTPGIYCIWVFLTPTELPFGLHLPGYCLPKSLLEEEGGEGEEPGAEGE